MPFLKITMTREWQSIAEGPRRQQFVVVTNRGAHSFTVLAGNGHGGFENPQFSLTTSTSDRFDINEWPAEMAESLL